MALFNMLEDGINDRIGDMLNVAATSGCADPIDEGDLLKLAI